MAVVAIASGVPAVLLRQEKQESTVGNGHAGNAAAERPDLGKKLVCRARVRGRHVRQAVQRSTVRAGAGKGRRLELTEQDVVLLLPVDDESRVRMVREG